MKILHALLLPVVLSFPARAQTQVKPEILVIGTFHMANPGRDLHSAKVDDVLSPDRQRQIVQLAELLKRFRPTKIAIESKARGERPNQYKSYLAGTYTLTRNEIDQIGFRLAKELGHQSIYPVDEDGEFPFTRVRNYALANGLKEKFEAEQSKIGSRVKAENEYLASHSIIEMLALMNADSSATTAVGEYYTAFLPFGEPYEYAGSDLIASWFQRNVRIYRNIRALVTTPTDRILVIYGAGHLGWLRQIVASDPTVKLRTLADVMQ